MKNTIQNLKNIFSNSQKVDSGTLAIFQQIRNSSVNPVNIEAIGNQLIKDVKAGLPMPKAKIDSGAGLQGRERVFNLGQNRVFISESKGSVAVEIITNKKFEDAKGNMVNLAHRQISKAN